MIYFRLLYCAVWYIKWNIAIISNSDNFNLCIIYIEIFSHHIIAHEFCLRYMLMNYLGILFNHLFNYNLYHLYLSQNKVSEWAQCQLSAYLRSRLFLDILDMLEIDPSQIYSTAHDKNHKGQWITFRWTISRSPNTWCA